MEEVVLLNIVDGIVSNTEDHLHVVRGTISSNSSVDVSRGGGGDEIVILSRFKLQSTGGGAEGSECDCEVHETVWFVTNCHNFWSWIGHSARVVFLLRDTVDHMLFSGVLRTDQMELVILPGKVVIVHVNNVFSVVKSEGRVGGVPVDKVGLHGGGGTN